MYLYKFVVSCSRKIREKQAKIKGKSGTQIKVFGDDPVTNE